MRVAAAVVFLLALAGCGSSGATSSSSSSTRLPAALTIKDFTFAPIPLTVTAGTAIAVANNDTQAHTITSDTPGVFDTGAIPAGGSPAVALAVATPGSYTFHCSFHPFMHGQLVVE